MLLPSAARPGLSCLSLLWAVLHRASFGRRGIDTSVAGIRRLQEPRRQLQASGAARCRLSRRRFPHDAAAQGSLARLRPGYWIFGCPLASLYEALSGSVPDADRSVAPPTPPVGRLRPRFCILALSDHMITPELS